MAVLCFILGLIPAAIGYAINWAGRRWDFAYSIWVSVAFFIIWGLIAYLLGSKAKSIKTVVIGFNAPAFIVLLYVALQQFVLHYSVLGGNVSSFCNYFCQPTIPFSMLFISMMKKYNYPLVILIGFILMVIVSAVGANYGKIMHNK